jgi:2-polyprenyl-6-methoxyphenol hydroxylase-like FAD-dependent oxidoreductase
LGTPLLDFKECEGKGANLSSQIERKIKYSKADIVVGADGIRSSVRRLLIVDDSSPLRYLGCILILVVCTLGSFEDLNSPLLDSATVFQTLNGN